MLCKKCGTILDDDSRFCTSCGTPVVEENDSGGEVPAAMDSDAVNAAKETKEKRHFPTKMAAIVAVICIVAAVLLVVLLSGKRGDPVVFVRDGQLMVMDGAESILIHDEYAVSGSEYEDAEFLSLFAEFSPDNKHLYYFTDMEDNGYSLYCMEISKAGREEAVKVSNSVSELIVPDDRDGVFYIKNSDGDVGKLYYFDMKNSEQIAKNVKHYSAAYSSDCVLYVETDPDDNVDSLHVYDLKTGVSEKIDNNLTMIFEEKQYVAHDESFVLYGKRGEKSYQQSIYLGGYETEKEKLISNAEIKGGNHQSIFYSITEGEKTKLYRYDVAAREKTVLCDDMINEIMINQDILYYFDDTDNTWYIVTCTGVVSEISGECVGASISDDGKQLVLVETSKNNEKLWRNCSVTVCEIAEGEIVERNTLTEDASADVYYDCANKRVYYFDDVDKNLHGTLFRWESGEEKEKISDDAYSGMLGCNEETNAVVYCTDVTDELGTMHLLDGKKSVRIGTDVNIWMWKFCGSNVVFLANWDSSNGGEMHINNGRESEKIEIDVQSIVGVFTGFTPSLNHIANLLEIDVYEFYNIYLS